MKAGFLIALTAITMCAAPAFSQDNAAPVKIAFDTASSRMDLITSAQLPDYTLAQRGSIQFFRGRLDTPEDFVTFFHDGVRTAKFADLASMEKVQPQFAIWRLRYKGGSKNTPRIHDLAVSFVPLSPETGKPERRVYIRLDDLALIDWNGNAVAK